MRRGAAAPARPGDGAIAAAWAPLVAELPSRRTIVLDRPGFGLSERFDYRRTDLRRHATTLLGSLLDALEIDSLPIVGSSGGAQWSLWFALPSPSATTTGKMLARADTRILDHPEIVGAYHEAMRLPGYGATSSAIFRRSFRVGGAARRQWVLTDEELGRIEQPVLIVWGSDEPFGDPAAAHRAAGLMPDARVEIVPRAWHHPWLADARGVGRHVLEFLGEHSA